MEYHKTYYQNNKEKWKKYQKKTLEDPIKHKRKNEIIKQWKKNNPEKVKEQKRKDSAKYYAKKKHDVEYMKARREYMTKYNIKHREHQKRMMAKHRAKPETKKKSASYNKEYYEKHPDKMLRNIKNHLNKLSLANNMNWHQYLDQLRGWSKIIHHDCNERCQVCGRKSTQAHHILHKSKYPQLSFNRNNGIALCDKCHYEVHGKMLLVRGI